ncbi:E3 ubiquitin-protein ligase Os04g0590900-like [Aristolochia californica]|uniref:E3 ubiquitin-protein ligase Os04g0590900-like n=1 Tax=Aristolochia californica TaxID=171875 RepID=UPI0035DE7F5B
MGTVDPPQTWAPWAPYDNNRDCSRGFCSIYCPQWCYIVFPPPPPFGYPSDDSSEANFSPLVIAIIGILASAFLLVSYYTVVSKYCGNFESLRRRSQGDSNEEFDGTRTPPGQEGWQATTTGLDEALIKSITVCKYKRGDGLVEGTDCSVCLSEFQDDENLRLLPKCCHAFHVPCIDTWLKSHSNCPLCRANIVSPSPLALLLPPPARTETTPDHTPANETQREENMVTAGEDLELGRVEIERKTPVRALSNLEERDSITEIREEIIQPIRRSFSMDYSRPDHISIADVLEMSMEDEIHEKDERLSDVEGSSRSSVGEDSKGYYKNRALRSVMSPIPMKKCSSSGRFSTIRHGRGTVSVLPM